MVPGMIFREVAVLAEVHLIAALEVSEAEASEAAVPADHGKCSAVNFKNFNFTPGGRKARKID